MLRSVDTFWRQVTTMAHRDIPRIGIYMLGTAAGSTIGSWAFTTTTDLRRKTREAIHDVVYHEKNAAEEELIKINGELEAAKRNLAKLQKLNEEI